MSVSQDDPRPSYIQVADDLRQAIEQGDYQAGQRLPSGRDLAKTHGVALNTAQRAVDRLKAEGVLVSYPPRGVFVAPAGSEHEKDHGVRPSPEYAEIMNRIDDLRSAWRDQVGAFEARLSSLEEAVGGSSRGRGQGPRSGASTAQPPSRRRTRGA